MTYFCRIINILRKFVFISLLPIALGSATSGIPYFVPRTSEEVQQYLFNAQDHALQTLDHLTAVPEDQRNTNNVWKPWKQLGNDLLVNFSTLTAVSLVELPGNMDARLALVGLHGFVYQTFAQNPNLREALLGYAKNALSNENISSYERFEIETLLDSAQNIELPQEEQVVVDSLKALNATHPKTPFIYLKSNTPDKVYDQKELKVMTLNACFLPGNLSMMFGGVLPWKTRIYELAEKILSTNADVVCLQEIHGEDAGLAIYEALKDHYTHFYLAIGPRTFNFTIESLGLPSGLFVASKYPLEKPEFTLFAISAFPMNYGFFDFTVTDGTKPLAHIYATHLQALNIEQFPKIRALQLQQILSKMQFEAASSNQIPFILCGDLNIPYGSEEPAEALLHAHFYNDYNKNVTSVNESNRTCTDYFTNYLFSPTKAPEQIKTNFQILDYVLLLKTSTNQYGIDTTLIPTNDLSHPELAVSDHHALLTTIKMNR